MTMQRVMFVRSLPALMAVAVGALWGCGSRDLVLAERGASPEYAIVMRSCATGVEKYAVREMRDFIKRQTDVELPIQDDATPIPQKAILVQTDAGDASLGDEGFSIRVVGDRLVIRGGRERGALYGVYEVLERFGGCAWYSSWHEVVPRLTAFKVPRTLDARQVPAFALREHSWLDMMDNPVLAERNRMHRTAFDPEKFGGTSWRFDKVLGKCHTFERLMPVGKWFDAHPEYFSEVGGKRIRVQAQLCLTNPDVVRICTEEVLKRVRESYPKGIRLYGVSQNDWGNACTCAKCKALDDAEGSQSATLVRFVNAIAEKVSAKYPDVFIETLVYTYTRKPPKTLRFHQNVIPCFCTIECDFRRPIDGSPAAENRAVCETIRQWGERSSNLMVWDYTTDFRNYLYTWPNVKVLGPNLRFFKAHGVTALYEQGCSKGRHADWGELKAWLLAKLMWNPDQDENALLDRYFRDNFGPAAAEVRRCFEEMHAVPRDSTANPMGCYEPVTSTNMPDACLDRCARIWDAAAKKTEGEANAFYARNVLYTRLSLDYTRARRTCAKHFLHKDLEGFDIPRYRDALEGAKRIAAVDKTSPIGFAEGAGYNAAYRREIEECVKRPIPDRGCTRLTLEESCLGIGSDSRRYRYVDDSDADDGRALWLSNTHYGWSGYFHVDSIDYKPGSVLRLRVRAKVKKNPSCPAGEAFWTGVYSNGKKKSVLATLAPRVENVPDNAYAWYDLGEWMPDKDEELWVAPGRFTDGHSCHDGVWIDKYEVLLKE